MVIIRTALPEPIRLTVRGLNGWIEQRLDPADPSAAVRLAENLATDETGTTATLGDWPVAAFDRLLLEIYVALYGTHAECRALCRSCGEGFEFDLHPRDIAAGQDADAETVPAPDAGGWWRLRDGFEVRAPRMSDVANGDRQALVRAVTRGDAVDTEEAEAFLERAAPVLDLDISAMCPNCDADQQVRFSLADYLVAALANERPFLIRETHLLASQYGWPHREILDLSRDDRRAYAALIESERAASQRLRRVL